MHIEAKQSYKNIILNNENGGFKEMRRTYEVVFYKGIIWEERTEVKVKANSYQRALKNARKKGYLLKDGWKWYSIQPLEESI